MPAIDTRTGVLQYDKEATNGYTLFTPINTLT